tara:strand:- start:530 stop:1543 length:1014 start_codon:yes stop_codon:yes gene_type:complete
MSRYVALSKPSHTAWGTAIGVDSYLDAITETLSEDNQVIFDEDISNRSPRGQSAGPFEPSGSVTINPRPNTVGYLFAGVLGSSTVATLVGPPTGCSNTKEHTIKQNEDNKIPNLTIDVAMSNPTNIGVRRYDSAVIDGLELTHDSEGRLELVADFMGRSMSINHDVGTPSFSTLNPFVFHMGTLSIASVANTDVQNMSVRIRNNHTRKPEANSRFPGKPKPGPLLVEGTLDLSFENRNQMRRFLGSSTATSPQDSLSSFELRMTWTSYTSTESCVAGTAYYKLTMLMPAVILTTSSANIDKQEPMVHNLGFRALYDSGTSTPITVSIINLDSSAYIT